MAKIVITNGSGTKVGEFSAKSDESITTQAEAVGIDIPQSCGGSGACGMCKCRVKSGGEFLDSKKFGDELFPVEDDEVLSCISGVQDGTPDDAVVELEVENL